MCAAVNSSKFPEVVSILSKKIHQAGDIEAAFNEKHKEIVLGYFNPDPNVSCTLFLFHNYTVRNKIGENILIISIFTDWKEICVEQCLSPVE